MLASCWFEPTKIQPTVTQVIFWLSALHSVWLLKSLSLLRGTLTSRIVKHMTIYDGGSLGLCIDEERSKMRYVVWIAEFSESSNLWTQIALSGIPGSTSAWVTLKPMLDQPVVLQKTTKRVERNWSVVDVCPEVVPLSQERGAVERRSKIHVPLNAVDAYSLFDRTRHKTVLATLFWLKAPLTLLFVESTLFTLKVRLKKASNKHQHF